jgi:uncharacterized repeat protein (TIGR03803 family)
MTKRRLAMGVACAALAAFAMTATAQAAKYHVVFDFNPKHGGPVETQNGAPAIDSAAGLYVAATNGGAGNKGMIFGKPANSTKYVDLHDFGGPDGMLPEGGVLYDESSGAIYGTTIYGGSTWTSTFDGYGTLWEIDPQSGFVLLHSFDLNNDGAGPTDAPVMDSKGNLYGVAQGGGNGGNGGGTIWKYTAGGRFTVLHTFSGSDGAGPPVRLIMDKKGNLFGVTYDGGAIGWGTIFELSAGGKFTDLHDFDGANDGGVPQGFLEMDSKGNFYGTTSQGGAGQYGTAYKLAPNGKFTVIHAFANDANGANPNCNLVLLKNKLYGTTAEGGGPSNGGVVFELAMDGTETVLHTFANTPDGEASYAGMVLGPYNTLYGDTIGGGKTGYGTLFSLKVK